MTELEQMQRAKMYIDKLAQGIDPFTNQEIPEDSVLNNIRLARCFFYVSDVLGQLISKGGVVGDKSKAVLFAIDSHQLAQVQLSPTPVRVTQLADMISAVVDNPQMGKLNVTVITNWLLEKGFLEKQTDVDGRSRRVPTQSGVMIGLSTQLRHGKYRDYQAVYYDLGAQQFVLDNLEAMLAAK